MKYLIFASLTILLFVSQPTLAQEWEELTAGDVFNGETPLISDLHEVAMGYVIQKGMFESTKAPFPGDEYRGGYNGTTYERRNTSTLTYYRYNFTLTEFRGPSAVTASVLISYNPSNSNFIVRNYNYRVDSDGNEDYNGEETETEIEDDPNFSSAHVDTRTLTGDGDLASVMSDTFDSIIAHHIESEDLPDSQYEIQFVYSAYKRQHEGDEEANVNEESELNEESGEQSDIVVEEDTQEGDEQRSLLSLEESSNEPQPGYRSYEIWLKAKNSEGKYYLVVMEINYTKENGDFVLEEGRPWSTIAFGG